MKTYIIEADSYDMNCDFHTSFKGTYNDRSTALVYYKREKNLTDNHHRKVIALYELSEHGKMLIETETINPTWVIEGN